MKSDSVGRNPPSVDEIAFAMKSRHAGRAVTVCVAVGRAVKAKSRYKMPLFLGLHRETRAFSSFLMNFYLVKSWKYFVRYHEIREKPLKTYYYNAIILPVVL